MSNDNTNNPVWTLLLGLLTIAFVVLKLCHVVDWSWWWVLSPLWLPVGALLAVAGVILLGTLIFKGRR